VVDRVLLYRKLEELETYQEQLAEFAGISLNQYRGDWKSQRIVERTLQIMIETCADIAGHVISDGGMRAPKSCADGFTVLGENGVLTDALLDSLVGMAKFRNVVVHQYDEVDAEVVIAILRKHLGTFRQFRDQLLRHLRAGKP